MGWKGIFRERTRWGGVRREEEEKRLVIAGLGKVEVVESVREAGSFR